MTSSPVAYLDLAAAEAARVVEVCAGMAQYARPLDAPAFALAGFSASLNAAVLAHAALMPEGADPRTVLSMLYLSAGPESRRAQLRQAAAERAVWGAP